jgi:acyl carrier protein
MTYNEIYEKTKEIIIEYLRLEKDEIHEETHMVDDLNADSIALVELGFRISETFSIPILEPNEDLMVFKNVVSHIYEQVNSTSSK